MRLYPVISLLCRIKPDLIYATIIKIQRSNKMGVNQLFKRTLISAAITLGFATAGTANAVDWLMLQGTEPAAASVPARVFGFVQAGFMKDYSSPNASGQYVPPKMLGPNLNAQSGFNVSHAQLGVRGTGFPLDDHINYFMLLEAGNTGLNNTSTGKSGPVLSDASVTLNYIKGARVRVGLFKTPGSDEGMQSTIAATYMDFSEVTNQLLLERYPNAVYTPNIVPQTQAQLQASGKPLNGFAKPVGGFRDSGVQVFDHLDMGKDWGLTYAAMVGQGSGTQLDNLDGKYDTYLYLSTENDGDGRLGGVKLYAWSQSGKRLADITNTGTTPAQAASTYDGTANPQYYKRNRSGLGVHYLAKPYRVSFEYITADGMIFEGPDKPSFYFAAVPNATGASNGATAKGNGWYLDGGWYIPNTRWELDARYDTVALNTGGVDEHKSSKTTLGVQYNFNPKAHVTLNYELRDFKCTASTPQCTIPNTNLTGVGKKIGMQVTTAF
jgi:hypothetical protein